MEKLVVTKPFPFQFWLRTNLFESIPFQFSTIADPQVTKNIQQTVCVTTSQTCPNLFLRVQKLFFVNNFQIGIEASLDDQKP